MTGLAAGSLRAAFAGKRVLLTGHTGFKGGWLAVWLHDLGAVVTGVGLPPSTEPSFFEDVGVGGLCRHVLGDIRDFEALRRLVRDSRPEVVFHLAAQALVRVSYEEPLDTLRTNVLGTANLLEALRLERQRCAVVVVTSDKCYENREWVYGYRENDPLGGHDVYSTSKGAAELVVQSYRRSFFPPGCLPEHGVALASARAGNAIGGGDWAKDRIVPDAVRALSAGRPVPVRNPDAVRPWQHVLEPLGGYLLLAERLLGPDRARFCEAWNFGPGTGSAQPVRTVVESLVSWWGEGGWIHAQQGDAPHEAGLLRLSIDKAATHLGWAPRWQLPKAVAQTAEWYRARAAQASPEALHALCLQQIRGYLGT